MILKACWHFHPAGSSIVIGNGNVFIDDELITTVTKARTGIFKGITYKDYPHHSTNSLGGAQGGEMQRADVLVNNAGICINNTMIGMRIEEFNAQRSTLRGAWFLTRRILRLFMLRRSAGRIINISSVVGHTGNAGQIPYTMEKAAMDAMTKSLAKELAGRNILVNSVAPGFILTDMTSTLPDEVQQSIMNNIPLGRIGRPEEVAEVVAFLAKSGGYINGSVIHVNGGMYGG